MSLYRITQEKLETVQRTTFDAERLLERKDLQRMLREDISPIGDDLMVIAEDYGEWESSKLAFSDAGGVKSGSQCVDRGTKSTSGSNAQRMYLILEGSHHGLNWNTKRRIVRDF